MVRIRLFRTGTKKRPHYRIVAMDQRRQRQGRVLEVLGTYHPLEEQVTMRLQALDKWLADGAQQSDTVRGIVTRYRKAQAAAPVEAATS
ncbi:MAG: 30S ribosomal protein S16 [Deltaproteobacteria bacterium]|nr:30S ribosomal protein S16 [Deltaproteobacteria bacterium]MBW2414595.1 30S ribosomal protein S16 [Deltaproteobacteria bacterium]